MWHSLWKYHPRIGYTYMPDVRSRVPFDNGGYLVRTNGAGFRSDREFTPQRLPGSFRALLFGDSQTAGDGVANADRFSDLLEGAVPGLEIFNYGLTGSGTDQHQLVYQECAAIEHDLLIIGLYVENIGRVNQRVLEFQDAEGNEVFYAKPYYELDNDELVLRHVPVPKRPWTRQSLPDEYQEHVYRGVGIFPSVQTALRLVVPHARLRDTVKKFGMRDLMQKITRFQPVPDYESPDNPKWLLLSRTLKEWICSSPTPVLLVPIPMWMFTEASSDPTHYQARFRELAEATGCHLHDPLPDLWKYTSEERRAFRFPHDTHLSPRGHQALSRSLAPVITRLMHESRGSGSMRNHKSFSP